MTTKTTGFDVLEQQIMEALAELRGARLDYEHSPNADTKTTKLYAERRLNRLLDIRPRKETP